MFTLDGSDGLSLTLAVVFGTWAFCVSEWKGLWSVAHVFNPEWVGKNTMADSDNPRDFPRVPVVFMGAPRDRLLDVRGACALQFDLWKREFLEWGRVDAIRVTVHRYQPPPNPYSWILSYGASKSPYPRVYVAEIDGQVREYEAKLRYDGDTELTDEFGRLKILPKETEFKTVYLEKEAPDRFILRVEAKKPGLYTISCHVDLTGPRWGRETRILKGPDQFLFVAQTLSAPPQEKK
jgi:hypothetical protein